MLIVDLLILFLLIYIIYLLSYSLLKGAPYAALGHERIRIMMELLDPKKGKRLVDLGSGDGRIVSAAQKYGVFSTGIEINPVIFLLSKYKTRNEKNANFILGDYWRMDLSSYNYITVWGTAHMMSALEKKLQKELKPGSKVVSNHFTFPNWKHKKKKNDVYLYIK